MKNKIKITFPLSLTGLLIFSACSSYNNSNTSRVPANINYKTPHTHASYSRMDYLDELRKGDAVSVDEEYCQWKDEDSYSGRTLFHYRPFGPEAMLSHRHCFGYVTNSKFDDTYSVIVTRGYKPVGGHIMDSYTEVTMSIEDVPRSALSIPVSGLCVENKTHCIGQTTRVQGIKAGKGVIRGIFPDGSVSIEVQDDFIYVGLGMNGDTQKKDNVTYFIRRTISELTSKN